MTEELIKYIANASNNLEELNEKLQDMENESPELNIAIQKLSEAVFWLSCMQTRLERENE